MTQLIAPIAPDIYRARTGTGIANQAVRMQHKVREMLVAQRTQLLNGFRGHLAKLGVIAAQGIGNMRALIQEGRPERTSAPLE
ncbi:hypothetical protein G4G27_10915 [Sphingomonas sp. So64.6b]|nr:hypothetical protein G4G27_10915 [Sphingomonas sp. So64.6b]